jgi:TfoX/Sxy family transcriptional regulator of competence genes
MTYGWLEKDGTHYLVPVTIMTQAEHNGTYWCRGLFTDYELFHAKARLVLPTEREQTQKSALSAQ